MLSLELIVDVSIGILDERGVGGLTLRGLAAELGSGVASLYWHVENKDALVALVADAVVEDALREYERLVAAAADGIPTTRAGEAPYRTDARTSATTALALARLRVLVLCLWDRMDAHRWLPGELARSAMEQPNYLRTWEYIGRQLAAMELTVAQQFPASMAVALFASGSGSEQASQEEQVRERRSEDLEGHAERWRQLDPEEFPFIRSIAEEFAHHDDRAQFLTGLDLLLSGIERQTWGEGEG